MGFIIGLILVVGSVIGLQVYASKQEKRWLGWIIPSISFIGSIGILIAMISYTVSIQLTNVLLNVLAILMLFLVINIPTLVLLGIYIAIRDRRGGGVSKPSL